MENTFNAKPVGPLGLIPVEGTQAFMSIVDGIIAERRKERNEQTEAIGHKGYIRDSYIVNARTPRFGSGEGKGEILSTVRGDDLYIMVDVCNYSQTYSLSGKVNHLSPDDHFSNLKRIIAATGGKTKRINVIMPFLYESRQHRRNGRESMDCALALQEIANMGVSNIITFDAHDPRIHNAIPLCGFTNFQCTLQFIQSLLAVEPDLNFDSDHMIIISPDEGAMGRAVYFGSCTGLDVGMFYKRRDFTRVVNGRSPIVAHEYLGRDLEGKDVIIIDDMISSGESMLDVARDVKRRKARKVFICSTFGLFTNGMASFDQYYEDGLIDRVLTTNLIYQKEEVLNRPYYVSVDMTRYVALIIDTLNHDLSVHSILNPASKIKQVVEEYKAEQAKRRAEEQ